MKIKRRYIFLPFILLSFGLLFFELYHEVRNNTIYDFNRQQMLLAQQAAKSIEGIFHNYFQDLIFLSEISDILSFTENGESIMESYFAEHSEILNAITRVGVDGRIISTIPENPQVVGVDISYQAHVKKLLSTQKPVVSDVFTAVQGYETIAYHVPIFQDSTFNGSIALLLSFDKITQNYFEKIRIGQEGFAWVFSKNGNLLFAPYPDPGPESNIPNELKEMILSDAEILHGNQGYLDYKASIQINEKNVRRNKHGAYYPVHLGNTYWTVVVATPEREILKTMEGFQIRLYIFSALALIVFTIYTYYLLKFWTVYKEIMLREQAERALTASEERFRMLMEQAPFAIEIRDPHGVLQQVNAYWYKLFGENQDSAQIGTDNIFSSSKAKIYGYQNAFRDVIAGQIVDLPNVIYNDSQNGEVVSQRHIHSNFYPLAGVDGNLEYIAITHEDISQRKQNEFELEKYRKHLEELVDQRTKEVNDKQVQLTHAGRLASLGEMATGVAHELNQPLSIIRFQSEILQLTSWTDIDKKEINTGLKTIVDEVDRASRIIEHMRHFARRDHINEVPTHIHMSILRSMDFFKEQFRVHDIVLDLQLAPDLPKIIMDPQQMEQIVVNFINNARYALDALATDRSSNFEKKVTIRTKTSEDRKKIYFEVIDNGIGMSQEVLEKCRDPFYTTKEVGQGTGLGLSIVHGIVQTFNGTLEIESKLSSGTRVRVTFPIAVEN